MPSPAPPFRVDVTADGLQLDRQDLARRLAALPKGTPVVVMIHGYRFGPGIAGACPHGHIFSLTPPDDDRKAISWPRHLGLDGRAGLALAFGWPALGSLLGAHRRAARAGKALAELAAMVEDMDPGRGVDVIAHSLGARVALSALPHAAPGEFRRLILLAAAETRRPARAALANPAGRLVQVVNVTTRENDLFDFLAEWLLAFGFDTALGQGIGAGQDNWLDLQIDQAATRAALQRLGHPLPPPPQRISHWSPYLRPGVFGLYPALLDRSLPLHRLAAALPSRADRRWSRLVWRARDRILPLSPPPDPA
jgi:hypothetical protein